MFCRYCGKQILDNAIFCPKCGKRLVSEKPPVQPPEQAPTQRG